MDTPKTDHHTSTLTTVPEATPIPTLPTSPSQSHSDSFWDFVNNLFPIEPGRSDFAAPGLTGFESPPIVLSPPHLNAYVESNLLERTHNAQPSETELVAESQDPCSIDQDCLDFRPQPFHECNIKETYVGAFQQPLSVPQPFHGVSQRYLQFKEVPTDTPLNNFPSSFTSNMKTTSHDPELSVLNLDAAFNNRVSANSSHSLPTLLDHDSVGNPPLGISKPSGIGLHLNNIIDIVMKTHGPIAGLGVEGLSPHILKNEKTCSFSAGEKEGHESKAISLTRSITLKSCLAVKAEKFKTPYETKKFEPNQPSNFEKINHFLSIRKRSKSLVNNNGNDSKRCCNCTKTKCLKLYCECFAAGMYCLDSCSCQRCLNNPENVHIVLERRHQIESRDPFAFAPKVIEDRNELLVNNENGSPSTPSLTRHKKGCKCKKSECSKNYCECFQANVGCTDRCQCNNCKNVHGKRKENYVTPEVAADRADVGRRLVSRLIDDHGVTALRKDVLHSEFCGQQPNFAPQTPSFQNSGHEKDSSKSRFMPRRYLPSPEFDSTNSSSPDYIDMFVETKTDILDVNSINWPQMICNKGATSSTPLIPSKPRGCTDVSRIGQLRITGSSILCRRSQDTPLIQAGNMTSINSINGSSTGKQVVLPLDGKENEVRMNNFNSSGRLKSRRYILKLMPPFPPLTPSNK